MIPLTVLYVEDDEAINRLFSRFLSHHIETVFTARDGMEGVKAFIAARPDVVISDVSMPIMGGIEMAERIRAIQPLVPILFLTAIPECVADFRGFQPLIDRVLAKPVDMRALLQTLESYTSLSLNRDRQFLRAVRGTAQPIIVQPELV